MDLVHEGQQRGQLIQGLRDIHEEYLTIFSNDVLAKIQSGDDTWEETVPPAVARLIKQRKLFAADVAEGALAGA